jgi:hypothetical protein
MKPEREAPEGEEVPNVLKRSGRGVYKLNGNEYEGDWEDDKMHGNGNFKFMGGSVYNVSLRPALPSGIPHFASHLLIPRSPTILRMFLSRSLHL